MEVATTITLLDTQPVKIPTTTFGPLSSNKRLGALLIGRSSSGINRLIILPGVIDADFTGQIIIVAYTLFPPCTIEQGTSIAQLILMEQHPDTPMGQNLQRGSSGFGSTGRHLVNLVQKMHQRPLLSVILKHCNSSKQLTMMCDTGADVTIISKRVWPSTWPLRPAVDSVYGVGGGKTPMQSQQPVKIILPEGQTATVCPYVMPLPGELLSLLGRDVMAQMGVFINIPDPRKNLF